MITLPPDLTGEQMEHVRRLIYRNLPVFSMHTTNLGRTSVLIHDIITERGPVKQHPHRKSHKEIGVVRDQVKRMLDAGVALPSYSPRASPVVLVEKKDSSTRFCMDYRRLNSLTKKDTHPLPRIDETLDQLQGARIFSSLDLASAFWQVPLTENAKEKTTFVCKEGLFEFDTMPFGLCNATSTFQRLMDVVLDNLRWECALVYVDDIIVFSKLFDQHLADLQGILERLIAADLKIKPSKCSLGLTELVYLGHVIDRFGIRPDLAKIAAVRDFLTLVNTEKVQSFLGLVNHYRKFVHAFALIAQPLYHLLKTGVSFQWAAEEHGAFERLKESLCSSPVLIYPNFELPFLLQTNASRDTIGAILSQRINGDERVVAYASCTLSKAERNYAITDKEGLALIFAIKHFRPYLHGSHFVVETDHAPLKALKTSRDLTGRLA
jgi:hypothetical protein